MIAPVDCTQPIFVIRHDGEFAERGRNAVDPQVKHVAHVRPLWSSS
jgi:hypothetical protein